jgi:Integrase core domain
MGSVGDCFDNAMCESFFATLECELLERQRFKTQVAARMAVFDFIEAWYNLRRRHSALAIYRQSGTNAFSKSRRSRPCGARPLCAPLGRRHRQRRGAVHGVAVADPNPISFSASASNRVKAEAEKLVSDQSQEDTFSNAKPMN